MDEKRKRHKYRQGCPGRGEEKGKRLFARVEQEKKGGRLPRLLRVKRGKICITTKKRKKAETLLLIGEKGEELTSLWEEGKKLNPIREPSASHKKEKEWWGKPLVKGKEGKKGGFQPAAEKGKEFTLRRGKRFPIDKEEKNNKGVASPGTRGKGPVHLPEKKKKCLVCHKSSAVRLCQEKGNCSDRKEKEGPSARSRRGKRKKEGIIFTYTDREKGRGGTLQAGEKQDTAAGTKREKKRRLCSNTRGRKGKKGTDHWPHRGPPLTSSQEDPSGKRKKKKDRLLPRSKKGTPGRQLTKKTPACVCPHKRKEIRDCPVS